MKVISNKVGSSRERVDAEAALLAVANWRITEGQRYLTMSSLWGSGERSAELWLTEQEAIAIARVVTDAALDEAMKRLTTRASKPE